MHVITVRLEQRRLSRYIRAMSYTEQGGSSEGRRKQLLFRCQRRGFKELDLIFGAFAATHLNTLNGDELDQLDLLLNAPDDDVYAWLRGHRAMPKRYAGSVFEKLRTICNRKLPAWNV